MGLDVEVDSAGTGDWHVGHAPDSRAISVARRNGVDISDLRARQVGPEDHHRFDHIEALDTQNLGNLQRMRPADATAELSLLLDHVPGRRGQPVADPYYGEEAHFDATWRDGTEGAEALARKLASEG